MVENVQLVQMIYRFLAYIRMRDGEGVPFSFQVVEGKLDLSLLKNETEEATIKALTAVCGVGVKVANCVSLFGLHHVDAFPIDVWIRRILENEYPTGYPNEKYSPYNGIYQQYMFYYYRAKYGKVK